MRLPRHPISLAMLTTLGAVCLAVPPAEHAADAPTGRVAHTLFVCGFENATGEEQYDPAADGIGDLLGVLMARQERIRVVERQQLLHLTDELARTLRGLTGAERRRKSAALLKADCLLTGRLLLVDEKLTLSAKIIHLADERVLAADTLSCRPEYLPEAALQAARRLAGRMLLPLGEVELDDLDTTPLASLHFAKALGHYYAGDLDAALMQFMRTLALDPDYIDAHFWSALAYDRLEEYDHAVIEYEAFLARAQSQEAFAEARRLLVEARKRAKANATESLAPDSEDEGEAGGGD